MCLVSVLVAHVLGRWVTAMLRLFRLYYKPSGHARAAPGLAARILARSHSAIDRSMRSQVSRVPTPDRTTGEPLQRRPPTAAQHMAMRMSMNIIKKNLNMSTVMSRTT
jgi:hypothetical protein